MTAHPNGYPQEVNITNCDREPIHIIGESQAHGVILACDKNSYKITQCSENTATILGLEVDDLLGKPLSVVFPAKFYGDLHPEAGEKILLPEIKINNSRFLAIAHTSEESLILDLEPFGENLNPLVFQDQLTKILNELNAAASIQAMSLKAASLVKFLFGYDRVMLYRFDEEWNGEVVAEEKESHLESWLGLHYPATDIPKPSRELFLKQGVRIISDVNYEPAAIIPGSSPLNNKPLDLSRSELRGVSPIHIEYLRNMKVGASLTAAIVLDGKLWGLLACHHYSARFLNYHQRQSVKFLTQIFSNRLAVETGGIYLEKTKSSTAVIRKLVDQMRSSSNIISSLTRLEIPFTETIDSTGGAVFLDGNLELIGKTPEKKEVLDLISNFIGEQDQLFHTNNLEKLFSPASSYRNVVSGLLSIKLGEKNEDYLIWFREESSQTVSWGGKPEKNTVENDGVLYLSPRKSFEKWTQKVSGKAKPWREYEIDAAIALKDAISQVMVEKQKEEIKKLNERLTGVNKELEAFSYSVSHDLRAPLRGIRGFGKILQEDYGAVLDEKGQKALQTILNSAGEMDSMINELLSYAKLGLEPLVRKKVKPGLLVKDILQSINADKEYPQSRIILQHNFPEVEADKRLLHQLLLNLVSNALKYSSKKPEPLVEIGFIKKDPNPIVFFVKDNGIGFDPKLEDKIFNVFSRLVGNEYSGSGVGLAIVSKVVEKHQGRIWVETLPQEGSVFYFTLEANKNDD